MERISQTVTFEDVVEINRRLHEIYVNDGCFYAGIDNLHYPDALKYIVGVLDESFFGQSTYPTVFDKAAALGHHIITRHVFHDGNKRTGMISALALLLINGYEPSPAVTDPGERIKEMALAIANDNASESDFASFLRGFFQNTPTQEPYTITY